MSHFYYCCCCRHNDYSRKMSVFVWMVGKEFTRHKISSQKLSRSHAHLGWRGWKSLLIWFSATDRYPSQGGRSNFLVTQFAIEVLSAEHKTWQKVCGGEKIFAVIWKGWRRDAEDKKPIQTFIQLIDRSNLWEARREAVSMPAGRISCAIWVMAVFCNYFTSPYGISFVMLMQSYFRATLGANIYINLM